MLPVEIFEYKQKWRNRAYTVRLCSDLRSQGKDYCGVQMFQHQWVVKEYTGPYEDTYLFEHKQDALSFSTQWDQRFVYK